MRNSEGVPSIHETSAREGAIAGTGAPHFQRYLSNRPRQDQAFLKAAEDYPDNLGPGEFESLCCKPFDRVAGNPGFLASIYQVANLLEAMQLPPGAKIVEVGSGPGWLTEILASLGFEVDAIEPSEAMIRIARVRLDVSLAIRRIVRPPRVAFHCRTFEQNGLGDETADAVWFHESLHHMVDENQVIAEAWRILKPRGVLGISGDTAWEPGNRLQEAFWDGEMERFGTLENPFTWEYLRDLLEIHGFDRITRYHGVNGLFPVEVENKTIAEVARFPARYFNTVTARKPGLPTLTTADPYAETRGVIELLGREPVDPRDPLRRAKLVVRLTNCGETTWLCQAPRAGFITLALIQTFAGGQHLRDSSCRARLPRDLEPGESVILDAVFKLPDDYRELPWRLDLVNENMFWLSTRGTLPVEIDFDEIEVRSNQPQGPGGRIDG